MSFVSSSEYLCQISGYSFKALLMMMVMDGRKDGTDRQQRLPHGDIKRQKWGSKTIPLSFPNIGDVFIPLLSTLHQNCTVPENL